MKKIPTIYARDRADDPKYVTREPNPVCSWVFAGEGKPTRKYDGTCVRFDGERWWARREVKPGSKVHSRGGPNLIGQAAAERKGQVRALAGRWPARPGSRRAATCRLRPG